MIVKFASDTEKATKPKRQNGYTVFFADFRNKNKDERKYRDYTFVDWGKVVSNQWKKMDEDKKAAYGKKAINLNKRNCQEKVGPDCTLKAGAKSAKGAKGAKKANVVTLSADGHSAFFDEICKAVKLHFVQKKKLTQKNLNLTKLKNIEKLVAVIKKATNFRVVIDVSDDDSGSGSDSDMDDLDDSASSSDGSGYDSDSSDGKKNKQKRTPCSLNSAVRQIEYREFNRM